MIQRTAAPPVRWAQHGVAPVAAGAAALAALVAIRIAGLHEGLLYPDGYQYLLMARGISEHLEPVVSLGTGDSLGPNADAAAKPLFPMLVAVLDVLGMSPLAAARAVTVAAATAVPVLTGLLAVRLGTGRPAALLAALLAVLSPTAAYWFGFAGPDPLAPALALGAALALIGRRPLAGGVLAGLCMLARPEYALAGLAAAIAGLASRRARQETARALAGAILTVGVLLAAIRPPLSAPGTSTIAAALLVTAISVAVLLSADRIGKPGYAGIVGSVVSAVVLLDDGAWTSLARRDWALVGLAVIGAALAAGRAAPRAKALRVLALSLPLIAAYWAKNPGLERYAAQLVPELALVAAIGIGTLGRRSAVASLAAGSAFLCALIAPARSVGVDAFRELAPGLERAPAGPIVTATPDAYALLFPGRTVKVMRPGARGLVLMDGAARALEPGLRAEGRVVLRIPVITGFLRPDGIVDRRPAVLYRGRVVER